MKTLDVRFPLGMRNDITVATERYDSNKSDLARAAMILGLKALNDGAKQNGELSVKGWIAALNGKVK